MKLYPRMLEDSLLNQNDTMHIAQMLHTLYRRTAPAQKKAVLPVLLEFAEKLIQDLKMRHLTPHTAASLHLVSFFKEAQQYDNGSEFWKWLSRQTDEFVDAEVYGAAIELLAYQGAESLEALEELYSHALKRYPGNFAEYHLSPEAIVPDRAQPTTIKGLPMSLLQGILTARILRGDWRKAYLALDTALRLFPTQVPGRFFELLMYERPVTECYKVFLIACRSGVILRPERLGAVLDKLVSAQQDKGTKLALSDRVTLLNGMINAVHAYIGAGGTVEGPHLSMLVKGFAGLLPERKLRVENDPVSEVAQSIAAAARTLLRIFMQAGTVPSTSTFNSLILLAGRANLPEMIASTTQDMLALGIEPDTVTYRTMVLAAGDVGTPQLVESSWQTLVNAAEGRSENLDVKDWQALVKAGQRAKHITFVQEQLDKLGRGMNPHVIGRLMNDRRDAGSKNSAAVDTDSMDPESLVFHMQQVMSRISSIIQLIQSGRLQDFFESPLPMSLSQADVQLGPEEILRKVYDELSTDPQQPPAPRHGPPSTNPTGFPLDELRFENWKSINELLLEAETYENEKQRAVDNAIASGKPMPKKIAVSSFPSVGSAEVAESEQRKASDVTPSEVKQRVLRLRGLDKPLQLHFDA